MAKQPKTETFKKWEATIKKEVPYIGLKPFSHNIVSLSLQAIAKESGNAAANRLIRKYGLNRLGWKEVNENASV